MLTIQILFETKEKISINLLLAKINFFKKINRQLIYFFQEEVNNLGLGKGSKQLHLVWIIKINKCQKN